MADPRASFVEGGRSSSAEAGAVAGAVNHTKELDYFSVDDGSDGPIREAVPSPTSTVGTRRRASLSISLPPTAPRTDMAFAALQYLPMPILVLSSAKTIVLANEAVGRLLGIDLSHDGDSTDTDGRLLSRAPSARSASEVLQGASLGQLGFDFLQNGDPIFMAWEDFLDTIVDDAAKSQCSTSKLNAYHCKKSGQDSTPTEGRHDRSTPTASKSPARSNSGVQTEVHDASVDVVFSTHRDPRTGLPFYTKAAGAVDHVEAKMIVSVWATEDEVFFTLTFTAASPSESSTSSVSESAKTISRTVSRTPTAYATSLSSGLSSSSGSPSPRERQSGSHRASAPPSVLTSPTSQPRMSLMPRGPPIKASAATKPTLFSKTNRLKNALMNSMSLPAYALWKDESFGVPNKAAVRLIYPWIDDDSIYDTSEHARDFLSKYVLYDEDFEDKIPLESFPIMRLMRDRKSFEDLRVGMYSAKDSSRLVFNVRGEPILDEKGEFLGGLVIFQDVTEFAVTINRQREENERQFEEITNMIPQMVWRTTPQGDHEYFSPRWYEYTGLSLDDSLGGNWVNAFHPDDLAITGQRWKHSLATGDEYLTEYRCRSATGDWRWMLGRALPMRDSDGKIVKWFGTCTDIHDVVLAREEAKQTRAQLERVIEHAHITLWSVDLQRKLSLFEGRPMGGGTEQDPSELKRVLLGMNIYDIFRLEDRAEEIDMYKGPLEDILTGRSKGQTVEVPIAQQGTWYRTRLYPLLRKERNGGIEGDEYVDGVVGVSMDITELKKAAEEIQSRDRENAHLMAQSVAAKEASKMKSQFLANMSHEIRTPIAGVIGMSDLLLDDDAGELTKEQRECAENIQRSANGLLTVINDILDFSKVESGRLDIEEVQFDLSVVIRDVNKMLSFAAERKGLKYIDDIQELRSWKVMGDPGRLRQVLTNLLTNSIKFTSEGSVTMRVYAQKETNETVEVHFVVEDTGIGIEEEVKGKLFKPFSQADSSTARRFGGTGLGLTISSGLVSLMHGQISLESKLGVGTKASFWIPFLKAPYQSANSPVVDVGVIPDRLQSDLAVSRTSSERSQPRSPSTPRQGHHHKRDVSAGFVAPPSSLVTPSETALELSDAERKKTQVLVVEDNPVNQQIALKTIRKLGFPVKAVWNGQEALEYLQTPSKDQPCPDVILMDVQMPIMDGYKATYNIRNSASFAKMPEVRATPIVAMTASAIQGDREKCEESGMDDYLAKPVKKPHLENMLVKWAIEGKRKRAELRRQGGKTLRPAYIRGLTSTSLHSVSSHSAEGHGEHLPSELDRLEFAHRAAFEQSAESTGDLAARQQQAEEKAIALRDDLLMEAGEDPKSKFGRGVSNEANEKRSTNVYDQKSKLTTENVERFTSASKGPLRRLRADDQDTNTTDDENSSLVVTVDDSVSSGRPKPPMGPALPTRRTG